MLEGLVRQVNAQASAVVATCGVALLNCWMRGVESLAFSFKFITRYYTMNCIRYFFFYISGVIMYKNVFLLDFCMIIVNKSVR